MKRMICILLAAAMLSSACATWAEKRGEALVVYNVYEDLAKEWSEMLGLEQPPIEADNSKSVIEMAAGDFASDNNHFEDTFNLHPDSLPDFYEIEGYEISDYVDAGLCAPFAPSEKMLDEISALPPAIQQVLKESIYTNDGMLYAYPCGTEILPMMFWVPDAWTESPFRDIAPPASYEELLNFLEMYLETPHDGYCFYYDVQDRKTPQIDWIYRLIECWIIQCCYNHLEINFNNPEFVSLLKRTVELANMLYKAEPNHTKQKGRQLFTQYYFGYTTNGKDQYSWKNLIPWRISSDQLPLLNIHIGLYCARNGSVFSDKATELFGCIVDHRQDRIDGHVNYPFYLELNKDWIDIDQWNKYVLKKYGERWKCFYMTQEYVDSIWKIEKYCVPCMVKGDYLDYFRGDASDECVHLINMCAKGNIEPEDFVTEMDRLLLQSK